MQGWKVSYVLLSVHSLKICMSGYEKVYFWCYSHPVDKAHHKPILLTGQIHHLTAFNFADQLLTCVFIPAALCHFTADCTAKELQRAGQSLRALCCRRGHGPVKNRPLPLNKISLLTVRGPERGRQVWGVCLRRTVAANSSALTVVGRDAPHRSNRFSLGSIQCFKHV